MKIRELPADTVFQLVERLHDKLETWFKILASVRFLCSSIAYFLLCYLRSIGRSNFDRGFHNLTMLIHQRHENSN